MAAAPVWSVDPRTGKQREQVAVEATAAGGRRAPSAPRTPPAARSPTARCARPSCAPPPTCSTRPRSTLVEAADAETALGPVRLTGELARTGYQLRAFADVVDEGAFLDVDHRPPGRHRDPADARTCAATRSRSASSPSTRPPTSRFAFSVPGGDTASALAAGCPVVVKAHPDHPATSELVASVLRRAAAAARPARGRRRPGPRLRGGRRAGQAPAGRRRPASPVPYAAAVPSSTRRPPGPSPIPFHGELGSLNPVVVTEAAAAERAEEIGAGLAGSMTLGVGPVLRQARPGPRPGRRGGRPAAEVPDRRGQRHRAPGSCSTTGCGTTSSPGSPSAPNSPTWTPR